MSSVPKLSILLLVFAVASTTDVNAQACIDGLADGYPCNNVSLLSMTTPLELGASSVDIEVNDIWGWTDATTGKEYALVGRTDGTSFVDMSDPSNPVLVATMAATTSASIWRDIKVYQDYAFVVADGAGAHGMQIVDLTRLRGVTNPPAVFLPDTTYTGLASAHNIVINESSGFAYAVGSNSGGTSCGGGLHMIDISTPLTATFIGCQSDAQFGRGYTHDAQCVEYHGPDTEHDGKEICFNSNEKGVNIVDVSNKQSPVTLSFPSYPDASYVHQGWLTDDHRYFYQNDELDERNRSLSTRTMIWDVSDLDDPVLVKQFDHGTDNIDHNLYVRGNLLFEANYTAGLRIFDISTRDSPSLVAFFDTWPSNNSTSFDGAWSSYPFFESGNIAISSSNGLFIVRTPLQVDVDSQDVAAANDIEITVYPNPYESVANVRVAATRTQHVTARVYDLLGREVARLFDGTLMESEPLVLRIDDVNLPAGKYLVSVDGESGRTTQNMVKIR